MTDYYQDPGATASDAEDGDITNKIEKTITKTTTFKGSTLEAPVDNIPLDSEGSYTINYSVTDSAGVSGYASRRVEVAQKKLLSASTCGTVEADYAFDANHFIRLDYDPQIATSLGQGPYNTPSWLDYLGNDSAFPFVDDSVLTLSSQGGQPNVSAINYLNPSFGTFIPDDIHPIFFQQSIELYPSGIAVYHRKHTWYHNFSQIVIGNWSGGGINGDKPIQVTFTNSRPPQKTEEIILETGFNFNYAVVADPWGDGNTFVLSGQPHVMDLKQGASLGLDFGQEVTLCFTAPTQDHVWTKISGNGQNLLYPDPQDTTQPNPNGWGGGHVQPGLLDGTSSSTVTKTLVQGEGLTMERPEMKANYIWSMTKVAKPTPIDWSGFGSGAVFFLSGQLV